MTKPAPADDWLLADPAKNPALGLGKKALDTVFGIRFTMPSGQLGAATGKHFKDGSASLAPTFATLFLGCSR